MDDSRTIGQHGPTLPGVAEDPDLQPGEHAGRYRITRLIGLGGMGSVYEAHDPLLDRRLAVKVLRGGDWDPADDEARARLLREAQALARLTHPHVVAVYDVGRVGERLFIAMDLVEGGTILDWLGSARRGWRDILDLYLRAGAGLAAAHDVGLVHRDFKPANVLIGNDGRVCVSDFGLVRLHSTPAPIRPAGDTLEKELARPIVNPSLTRQGMVVGSPGYMAPEQMIGDAIGAAADVFSFAVSLWEALFGDPPFAGKTLTELCHRIMLGPPPVPPGDVVPPWLSALVIRGLAPRPEDRPTMRALLEGFERERQHHVLARAGRLLEEAGALARTGGGDQEFARIAARLMRDFVDETVATPTGRLDAKDRTVPGPEALRASPSTEPPPPDEDEIGPSSPILADVEMSGQHAQALLGKLGFQALASHFMMREGVGTLLPDGTTAFDASSWYPALSFVRAAHKLVDELGPRATFQTGLFAKGPRRRPRSGEHVLQALTSLDINYHRNFRLRGKPLLDARGVPLPGIGRYLAVPAGPRALIVNATGPWPCELDHSVVTGVASRAAPDAIVEHDPLGPCRKRGARRCVYHVRWGVAPAGGVVRPLLRRAASAEDLLSDPDGRYLVGDTFVFWYLDRDLDGTIFRGRPSADELRDLIDMWDILKLRARKNGSMLDLRRVTEIPPDTFAVFEGLIKGQREDLGARLRGLAVLRPPTMAGAVVTGVFQMWQVLHPIGFFDDERSALAWLGREDKRLLAELQVLAALGG